MGQSSYPSVFDSDVELPRVEDNISEIGGEAINSLRDAIFSIEQAVGLNPQGNRDDLVARVDQSIDLDGRIKQSALDERGLVTLPISDMHVGDGAAILEAKLDLDYGTTILNGKISSNTVDIDALRTAFNAFAAQTIRHFGGLGNRHDGYHIDLTVPIRSSEDVETIINVLNNAFTEHEASVTGAHTAYGISVNDEFANFSADNVQDALTEIDGLEGRTIRVHQDTLHDTAVALNNRGEQGSTGNATNTVMAHTVYETEQAKATNIIQVMRPNVARVTGYTPDIRALEIGSAQSLRVQAGGIDRGPIDLNLAAIIPTDDIDEIVSTINTLAQGCEEHYPIAAYNVDGKIVIAHTIAGDPFTITILDSVQFSAATALGFSDSLSTEVAWSEDSHAAYIGGRRIIDFKSLVKVHYTHATYPLNTLAPGLGDLSLVGLSTGNEGRVLCNITNHSANSSDNGTHYILGYPNDETLVLSADISLGSFDLEILANSVNFENSANGELYDIFVEADTDGYGIVTKSSRVSYGPISGVDLKSISENFPTQNIEWQIVDTSSIVLHEGSDTGISVDIPTGFQGQLKVMAPDNVNSMLFEVTGVPSAAQKSMTITSFSGTDDRLYIGSAHYSGNNGLAVVKYPVDRRRMGASVENKSYDELAQIPVEETTKELRNNGIVRGFDIISTGSTSFKIRGGRALINGRMIDVETQTVEVSDVSSSGKLLALDKNGNFVIKDEFDAGFTFSELTSGDAYGDDMGFALIAEFETDGVAIDGSITDRRLMVNKLDKRLLDTKDDLTGQITELRNTMQGSSWGFTIADASGGIADDDGYLASIEMGSNNGFSYVPYSGESPLSGRGFGAGNALITTRRFEFSEPDTMKTSVFRSVGLTHINVFIEAVYTGIEEGINGPFGVSGTVYIEVGVAVETGMTGIHVEEGYARVKTINLGVLPAKSQTERYVASIPVSILGLSENVMFDVVPRVRIVNSNHVDGGTGADNEPTIRFDNIRVVTSSYSIAGDINDEDGSTSALAATVGEIL